MTTVNTTQTNNKMKQLDELADQRKLVELVRNINSNCDTALYHATSHQHDLMKYNVVLPSGPRLSYEGLHEDEQKVINAQIMGEGVVVIKVTLLAAGFVVGTKGRSIHQISSDTGTSIKSWTLYYNTGETTSKALRAFKISGSTSAVLKTMQIITTAVDRYKELTEGEFTGQSVNRDQVIEGITFEYRPPPKRFIPKSARTIQQHDPPKQWDTQLEKVGYGDRSSIYSSQDSLPFLPHQYSSGELSADFIHCDAPSFYKPPSPGGSPRDVFMDSPTMMTPQFSPLGNSYNAQYNGFGIPPRGAPLRMYSTPTPAPLPSYAPAPTPAPVFTSPQYMVQPSYYMDQRAVQQFSAQPTYYTWW